MSAGNDGSIDREVEPRCASNDHRGNFTSKERILQLVAELDYASNMAGYGDKPLPGYAEARQKARQSLDDAIRSLPDETKALSKALEVGENLAKAADAYRVARHDLEKAEEIGATDMQGLHDAVADCWRGLGRAIHEFRKRALRLRPSAEETSAPLCGVTSLPDTKCIDEAGHGGRHTFALKAKAPLTPYEQELLERAKLCRCGICEACEFAEGKKSESGQ